MELFDDEKICLPDSASCLLTEILNRFPRSPVTLRKLMSLGRVIYSDKPQMTAAVMNTKPFTLVFGRPFLEANIKKDEDLVYLLCHELTHLVLDHFASDIINEFQEHNLAMKAMHIIVDCQVNASCYHILKEPRFFEFVQRFYKKDQMPYCFFRVDGEPPEELKPLHTKLFSTSGVSNAELIEGLMGWFKQEQDKIDEVIKNLLGNHFEDFGDKSNEGEASGMPDLKEAAAHDLSDLLDRPLDEDTQKKLEDLASEQKVGGKGSELIKKEIQTCLDRINHARELNKEVERMGISSPSARIFQALNELIPKYSIRSVIPNFHDNRTVAHYKRYKKPPIFNKTQVFGQKVVVPCYVDVSGSQDHVIPFIIPVVSRLKRKIGNVVHCFSNEVSETRISDFSNGKYKTTGGTDFNPIVEHILKNGFKRALILTDGHAYLKQENIQELKRQNVEIKVGWTVPDPNENPLKEVAKSTFFVFDKN